MGLLKIGYCNSVHPGKLGWDIEAFTDEEWEQINKTMMVEAAHQIVNNYAIALNIPGFAIGDYQWDEEDKCLYFHVYSFIEFTNEETYRRFSADDLVDGLDLDYEPPGEFSYVSKVRKAPENVIIEQCDWIYQEEDAIA